MGNAERDGVESYARDLSSEGMNSRDGMPSGQPQEDLALTSDLRPIPRVSVQSFCLSEATSAVIEAASRDRRMARAHSRVMMGGIPAAAEFFTQSPTPNLIIVEVEPDAAKALSELDTLAEYCDPGTKVVVIGRLNDVSFYRDLMQRGVSEYIVSPVDVGTLISTIGNLYENPEADPLGKTIAFFGVKGGCGASTIAHNVAWALARDEESEVVLADFDLPFGTAGLDFNQDPLQGVYEAVSAPERLDETFLDRILSRCTEHLSLLAAPASLERAYDHETGAFENLVDTMRHVSPTIVIDVPHAWNGWVRHTLAEADEIVIVAEPDLANLRNAKNVVDTLQQLRPNDRPVHLVINRMNMPKRPEIKPDEFAKALNLTVLASIPFEPGPFGTAANNGQMIAELDSRHAVNGIFTQISQVLSGRQNRSKKAGKSALSPLLQMLKKRKSA